jgi:hypothetical protein
VTELSNENALPETDLEHEDRKSPWTMLVTMILLSAGLLLSGAMLLNRAQGEIQTTNASAAGLAAFLNNGKTLLSEAKNKAAQQKESDLLAENTNGDEGVGRFFQRQTGTVRWPKLKLTGFGSSTDGASGFAIINGQHVIAGQQISKVTVIDIGAQSVMVEFKGEQRTLSVDPTD